MITVEDSVVLDELLHHVGKQRDRAKLVDKPFELGVMTDKRPSQILDLVDKNEETFKEIGMTQFIWHDDALRSTLNIYGEKLLFSISGVR